MSVWTRKRAFPGCLSLVLLFFLGLWVYYELMNAYVMRKEDQLRQTLAVSEMIGQFLQHESPSPRSGANAGFLRRLSNIVERTDIEHIRVESETRPWLSVCPEPTGCPRPVGHSGTRVGNQHVVVWRGLQFAEDAGTAAQPPDLRLVVVMQARRPLGLIHTEARLLLAVMAMGCVGIAVLGLAWSASFRNRALRERLRAAHDRRDQIEELSLAAAGLAHETKNPLGIIRGMAQQIAAGNGSPDSAKQMAREIMEEADITTARLGDFLSYAKTREPGWTEIDARSYIARIEAMMADDFQTHGITFVTQIDDITIVADPDMLSQVLLNLLANSLNFTEAHGTITVSLHGKGHDSAELCVADNGKGISSALLPKIFKPYVSKRPDGCGIGLAIVKRIIEQCGWEIRVESAPGKGTRFTISQIKRAGAVGNEPRSAGGDRR